MGEFVCVNLPHQREIWDVPQWTQADAGQGGVHLLSGGGKINSIVIAPVTYLDFAAPPARRIMELYRGLVFSPTAAGNGNSGQCRPPGVRRCPAVIFTGDLPGCQEQLAVLSFNKLNESHRDGILIMSTL